MGRGVDAECCVVGQVAVALGVLDELAEVIDAPLEVAGLAPSDFRGALAVHPVLVQPLGAARVGDLAADAGRAAVVHGYRVTIRPGQACASASASRVFSSSE